MAVLAPPVQVVTSGAPPFVAVSGGAPPFVATTGPAPPITIVTSGAPPITLFNEDGSLWAGGGAAVPVNTVLPAITGTPQVGSTLTSSTGTWTGAAPITYTYAWGYDPFLTGTYISGATASTYVPVSADIGKVLWCEVAATNAAGPAWAATPEVGPVVAVGGAALLAGETAGFATDFVYATDAQRVAVKVASVNTSYGLDGFYTNTSTSPKQVFDVSGNLVWVPHNMFLNSGAPVTQTVGTVSGFVYTVSIVGSGSITVSGNGSGVATAASPLTFTANGTSCTFTKAGTVTQFQLNRGTVATAYLATAGTAKIGLAVDYHSSTHAALGLMCEPAGTNLLLNNTTLSTQSVTVSAVAYTLSFLGTGTITLTGVSTAGPLVGTGAADRVSLTFTPTAGSLTCTVSGTVSNAQLETGPVASSIITTYSATVTRTANAYSITPASINYSATAGSWYVESTPRGTATGLRIVGFVTGTATPSYIQTATAFAMYEGTFTAKAVANVFATHKTGAAYATGDRAFTADGLTIVTDAGATTSLLSPGAAIQFGGTPAGGEGHMYIRKLYYLPRRMTNGQLVTATT